MVVAIVGVAGGTGSGKTTLVRNLHARFGPDRSVVIAHDAYYLDHAGLEPEARAQLNFDHPDALETARLVAHLAELAAGRAIDLPVYDFRTHTRRAETRRVEPREILLVDGILALAVPALREACTLRVYVDTPADLRFIRRLQRDQQERGRSATSVVEQYLGSVRPMHEAFVAPSRAHAHVCVEHGGENRGALEEIAARIEASLAR